MSTTPIFSFQDCCEMVWETFNPDTKPPTGRELRLAKAAVATAYRDCSNAHKWAYYQRRTTFKTDADQSSSTITFDYTGGAYERMLTIAAGTWPTNAARGTVVISSVHYDVEERKSDTIITLTANSNPGADVAAGTTYLWYRDSYPLPVNFRKLLAVVDCTNPGHQLEYQPPSSHLAITRDWNGVGDPDWFTIRNEGDYIGSLALILGPAPDTAKSYELLYTIAPPILQTYKYATGTISCTAGSTTVTGAGTAFAAQHKGCILRLTTSTTLEPTEVKGNIDGTDNPYFAQRIVTSVTNSATLVIDAAVSATTSLSGTKYVLSDPIDVEPLTMRSYFEALCSYHYARLTKRKEQSEMLTHAHRELLSAMANDSRSDQIVRAVPWGEDEGWNSVWGTVDGIPS